MAEKKDYSAEALLAKEKEVELDTDDVKEEKVEVEDKAEVKYEPNLNLGEVDLEYTDHSKPSEDKKDKPKGGVSLMIAVGAPMKAKGKSPVRRTKKKA